MTATRQASQELIEQHQHLVRSIAISVRRKAPRHIELDDLVAYGQVGLAQAARDFDPKRGTSFSTYAYYRIRGSIYDGLSKLSWTSRARYHRLRYDQMANEVISDSVEKGEAAQERPVLENEARWLGNLSEKLAVVYLTTHGEVAGKSASALADSSIPAPADQAAIRELAEKIRKLVDQLPEQAAQLIRATYFDGMTLQDAGKLVGISKSWASRLHAKTLRQLAQSLILQGIHE
jgi:RNA polymerase sigma factor for flagellar operon FliA